MNNKLLHISDTHSQHLTLIIPEDINIICHTGDESNYWSSYKNEQEFYDFIDWFSQLDIKHKLFIPGNHSSYIYKHEDQARRVCYNNNITFLHKEEITIDGMKFYGDATTPTFGDWFYMASRTSINRHWEVIPDDVNILLLHGPPKNTLDLSFDQFHQLEFCGCSALVKRISNLKDLKLILNGHIHSMKGIDNQGILYKNGIYYSNASCVTDGIIESGCTSHGNIFTIENKEIKIFK